ncbi:MAG TPA: UxaA family hydrolase, partial [Clostridia bacterium]
MIAAIRIHPSDNVVVLLEQVDAGQDVVFVCGETIKSLESVHSGHKLAVRDICRGEQVCKYGFPIGQANQDIHKGEWVHVHNLITTLREQNAYSYRKADKIVSFDKIGFFNGYLRSNGSVGIRNEIWILPMVGCVNHTAKLIAEKCKRLAGNTDGVFALEQPYGCSQLGQDHENTVTILKNIATHPNAAGVLLVALGCENNTMDSFLAGLGDYDQNRIRYVIAQDHADEIAEGVRIVRQLARNAKADT